MATNWIYYPAHPDLQTATLTATAGTSSTVANTVNTRILSRMDVDTLGTYVSGTDEFMYRIDFGSGNTKQIDFIYIVGHNLYQETASLRLYYDISDNASLTSPATLIGGNAAVSTDEPIWVETIGSVVAAKRYYWVLLDSIAATAYAGCIGIGYSVNPSVDPNWERSIEINIESGRIVNASHGGFNWKTRTHGVKRGWQVGYELISESDKDELLDWLSDADYADTPFVFTNDGGTTFYYGELIGNPILTPVQSGLYNLEFTISEVIA